jgi:hypothetical protein
MAKLLAAAAVLIGVYAIYDSQRSGTPYRLGSVVTLTAAPTTPGNSVGSAAIGLAGQFGN